MVEEMSKIWIHMSANVAELQRISSVYTHKDFPDSTDRVQIPWEGYPFVYRISFTGKEVCPTLGFNVTAAHDMRHHHFRRSF